MPLGVRTFQRRFEALWCCLGETAPKSFTETLLSMGFTHPRRPRGSQSGRKNVLGESYCKIETSPWALTLTEPVLEEFELPISDWPQKKYFCGQSAKMRSLLTLMFSYTTQFSSSIAIVAQLVQQGKFLEESFRTNANETAVNIARTQARDQICATRHKDKAAQRP